MKNVFPWKILKRRLAVNKPCTAWFNAVTRVLSELTITYSGDTQPSIERPNTDGSNWQIRLPNPSAGKHFDRFRVTDQGDGSIHTKIGIWTRRGVVLALAPDAGETYLTTSGIGANDFVYVQLNSDTPLDENANPALYPDYLSIESSGTNPNIDDTTGLYWVLGKFTNEVWKQFWLGDIDDFMMIPDAASGTDGSSESDARNYSLDYADNRTYSRHQYELEDHGWTNPTEGTPTVDELIMFRAVNDAGWKKKYCTSTDLVKNVDWTEIWEHITDDDDTIGDTIITYLDGKFEHTKLLYSGYTTALGVGKSLGGTDHDDVYWRAFNDSSGVAGHDTWTDAKTYKTSGLLEITNTTEAGAGAGAILTAGGILSKKIISGKQFSLNDGAGVLDEDNIWNIASSRQTVSGLMRLESTASSVELHAKQGIGNWAEGQILLNAGTDINLVVAGDLTIDGFAGWSGVYQVTIAGISKDVTVTKGIITDVS